MGDFLLLCWTFLKIGALSFGGGWAIVGLIKREVMAAGWMDGAAFDSMVAIAQVTPGPVALNAATLVGWQRFGFPGALCATASVIAIPVAAILLAPAIGKRIHADKNALDESLKGGTQAMMLVTFIAFIPSLGIQELHVMPPLLAAAAFGLSAFTKVHPLLVILGAGLITLGLFFLGA